ncbi:hypothetical protein CFIO01_10038 [Colletotrichum fioriniae PJ7]|uniref:Phosphoribosylaminoimidazole-succinocarboxamide synthase n=1 Tax=Colletotrichum fioriniae PJ7 TaxID=1445577 RepID=A0A010RFA0_9PEZI|nr:hypothetical protein CFIO01_10038 [Colletotrichum fioriniae PJ7]
MASTRSQAEGLSQGPTRTGSPAPDVSSTHENVSRKETTASGLTKKSRIAERDKLDYRPFILSNAALFGSLIINCGILAGLIVFEKRTYFVVSTPAYYALLASLILIGTCTVTHLEAMLLNLFRMMPFILCAREQGATMGQTILRSYFPSPSFWDAWETKNWLLMLAYTIYYPSYSVIGFKSALLYESWDDTDIRLHVNDWACYTLIAFYSVIQLYLIIVIIYLWQHKTGVRWDPVSIADILVLFRHSNTLKYFEGSSIAQRQSMVKNLEKIPLHLKYWGAEDSKCWHGFGIDDAGSSDDDKTSPVPIDTLALIRYNSAWAVANPISVYFHFFLAFSLMVLFTVGISITPSITPDGGYCWAPQNLSRNWANFLLDVVLTTAVSFLSDFWAALSLFVVHTEPLARMARPSESGEPAKYTLLLNYTSSFLPVRIYNAFMNKHWKLVRIMFWELLQRLFPTLIGTSIIVYSRVNSDGCVVCFSMPLFIVVIVGLASCAGLIFFELLLASVFRRTPRDYLSIADIVSWSSTSQLLHREADSTNSDESEYDIDDPLDVDVHGEKGKRWYMQSRLELQLKQYRLGYAKVPGQEYYAFGITDEIPEKLPEVRPTRLARKLELKKQTTEESGLPEELDIVMRNRFKTFERLLLESEDTTVSYDNGEIFQHQIGNEPERTDENP